ncbi:hypothetical protein Tco_0154290 [Tanacetum coccineum]
MSAGMIGRGGGIRFARSAMSEVGLSNADEKRVVTVKISNKLKRSKEDKLSRCRRIKWKEGLGNMLVGERKREGDCWIRRDKIDWLSYEKGLYEEGVEKEIQDELQLDLYCTMLCVRFEKKDVGLAVKCVSKEFPLETGRGSCGFGCFRFHVGMSCVANFANPCRVKVRWNSKRGPEFTWEREDYMKSKYPQLFVDRADSLAS